jgi:hypothetical protein
VNGSDGEKARVSDDNGGRGKNVRGNEKQCRLERLMWEEGMWRGEDKSDKT